MTFDQAPGNQNSSVLISKPIIESTVQSPGYRFCTLPLKTILGHAFGILAIFSLYPTVATFSGCSFTFLLSHRKAQNQSGGVAPHQVLEIACAATKCPKMYIPYD